MTIEITLKDTLEPSIIQGTFTDFVNDLNIAAAAGKQYVLVTEQRGDGSTNLAALETRSITRAREMGEDAFIGL